MNYIDDSIDFNAWSEKLNDAQNVVAVSEFKDRAVDLIYNHEIINAPYTSWSKLNFQMRKGEVSVYCGFSGHGKTLITSQIASHLMIQKKKILIASFEMRGESTLLRMVRQCSNAMKPEKEYFDSWCDWSDGLGWIYDVLGNSDAKTLEGVINYCATELKVEHFFIDSLTKVMRDTDNYNEQKHFLNRLTTIAQDLQIHIHLICHSRKKQNENETPNKFDVAGATDITNLADNVFTIWRNKVKENILNNPYSTPADIDEVRSAPDCIISCEKQRHFDWEGRVGLFRCPDGNSFTDNIDDNPFFFRPKINRVVKKIIEVNHEVDETTVA